MLKKNFTRKDLANKIYKKLGFSKRFSSSFVDDFFETLSNLLIKTNTAKISNFGTFKIVTTKERMGRNPKTKIAAKIISRKVVKFKPASFFKRQLNQNEE